MNKRKIMAVSALFFLIVSASFTGKNEKIKGYKIYGHTTGFPDSTQIFLNDLSDGSFKNKDSAFIINGKFSFSGYVKEGIIKAALRSKDFTDWSYFWLENTAITFRTEKGKFKEAVITGSKTQEEQYKLNSLINSPADQKEQNILFIQQHPSSIISADLLSIYSSSWNKDTVSILYNSLSKKIKNTIYGKNVAAFLTLNKNLKIGDRYADFSQTDINDKTVKLSDFKGKVVLLDFWGSWCGPCRRDNPELVKTYNEYKGKGFEILGVAADTQKDQWLNAVTEDGLTWPNVCDLKGDKNKAALIYGVSYYPANFLIDKSGIIIAKDIHGKNLKEKLKVLLE